MRLYLSSFRVGNRPGELMRLLDGGRRTALIANSCDALTANDRIESTQQEMDRLAAVGLEPYEVDLRDYFGADRSAVTAAISGFDLVWLRGGNAFVLRRALHQSGADVAFLTMLRNDAIVYGGYSAGVCVLAPSLRGLELVDDPNHVPPGYHPAIIWNGLDVLPYAVAPHYESDHPESAAIGTLVEHYIEHDVPFRALRDGQAIVIDGAASSVEG
ncbi:MAG TPA: Type 1 glutamine amidotransferase-like domain-containing protein [Candidatus Dormibacteraeota bacterium]